MLSFIRPTRQCQIVPILSQISSSSQRRRSLATFDGRCRASRLLQPLNLVPHEAGEAVSTKTPKKFEETSSKSSRLLVDLGFIRPASPGTFTYLNLALRSLEKLTSLADVVMEQAGCQKILLPTLVSICSYKVQLNVYTKQICANFSIFTQLAYICVLVRMLKLAYRWKF